MKRVLVVGLDGLEPSVVDRLLAEGALPNLARIRADGGYARVSTTAPAQTPVAWSTLAVGRNPGGHGIYDFLRRDPETYRPDVALHRYEQKTSFLPPRAVNLRRGTPLWELLGEAGIPSVVLRHPCTYPPDKVRGRMLAGVGVPDVRGGFGTGTVYTERTDLEEGEGERVVPVASDGGAVRTFLPGPRQGGEDGEARLALEIERDGRGRAAAVRLPDGGDGVELEEDRWSAWLSVRFKLGLLQSVRGRVRFFPGRVGDPFLLYASPVNFDPRAPVFPISDPWDYAGELEDTLGAYHTLGMAEDHNGLNNGRLDEGAFLAQCGKVLEERRKMMRYELDRFDEGLFFCVFDTPDRIQHMFWRFTEADHPANARHGWDPDLGGVIDDHYRTCDGIVGEALERADDETLVLVVSDHGFRTFRREVHLNAWLRERGLLTLREGVEAGEEAGDLLGAVDWSRTRAYAVGFAGIYLNLEGREARGVVREAEAEALKARLSEELSGLADAEGGAVAVRRARPREAVYEGPLVGDAPDVIVGCAAGYRVSSSTALGGVAERTFSDNRKRWSGDHVMDPELVPGVLFLNRPFDTEGPDLVDVAPTILHALGVPKGGEMEGRSLLP